MTASRRQALCLALLAGMVPACGGSPTAPEPNSLASLLIEPANIELGVGLSLTLTATGRFSDGSAETVPVQWSVTPNSVATISASGELFGVRLGLATITAVHASGIRTAADVKVVNNPAFTFPPEADMSGLWSGEYLLDVCVKISGAGPSTCRFSEGSRLPIQLELTQDGTRLTGRLTLYSDVSGAVSGWRDSAGFHVLFGKLAGTEGSATLSAEITKWDVKATVALNEMTGTFETVDRLTSGANVEVYRRGGTFVNVRRGG